MSSRRLLLVSAFFAPSGRVGARRAEKLATSFVKRGWTVEVLTLDPEFAPPLDFTVSIPKGVNILSIRPKVSPRMVESIMSRGVYQSIAVNNRVLRSLIHNPISRLLMKLSADKGVICPYKFWIAPALREVKGKAYDLVIGSVPPVSAAILAMRIAKATSAQFVLDYRDPWARHLTASDNDVMAHFVNRLEEAEQVCLSEASLISVVSPTLGVEAKAKTKTPVRVVPHGYESIPSSMTPRNKRIVAILTEGKFNIVFCYAGNLLNKRSLVPLFKIAKAITEVGTTPCHVIYCGGHEEIAFKQAETAGARGLLISTGLISRAETNYIMSKATANVVVISDGCEYAYPGKLWDSIAAGRPIIVIGKSDGDSARLVSQFRLGIVLTPHDDVDIGSFVKELKGFDTLGLRKRTQSLEAESIYGAFVREFGFEPISLNR